MTPDLAANVSVEAREPVLRRAKITWASDIEMEPVTWAWTESGEGRIAAGTLAIAAGREGTGKSSFGIWMSAHITLGTLPGAYLGGDARVLYVAVEDSWKHTLGPRLAASGADRSKVGRFEVVNYADEQVGLSLPHDNALLEEAIVEHNVKLVVIDPLMSVIGQKIDTHREREVRTALDPLAQLADRTGAIILGIAHFNKSAGGDISSLITGSGAFKNVPRAVFGFAKDEDDENGGRVMTQSKNSLGREDLPSLGYRIESAEVVTPKGPTTTGRFTFTGHTDRSVSDVLRESRHDADDGEERRDAASWISTYLGGNPSRCATDKEVLAAGVAQGFNKGTLRNARKKVASTTSTGYGAEKVTTWTLRAPDHGSHHESQGSHPLDGVNHVNVDVIHDESVIADQDDDAIEAARRAEWSAARYSSATGVPNCRSCGRPLGKIDPADTCGQCEMSGLEAAS